MFWTVAIALVSVITSIIIIGALRGNILGIVGQSEAVELQVAGQRVQQGVDFISSSASHGVSIDFGREVDVSYSGQEISLETEDAGPVFVDAEEEIIGVVGETETFCIRKSYDGQLRLSEGFCEIEDCTETYFGEGTTGYTCKTDEAFSQENFSKTVRTEENPENHPYVEKEYMNCPDTVSHGATAVCHGKISYRCFPTHGKVDFVAELGDSVEEREMDCTGQHEEVHTFLEHRTATTDLNFELDIDIHPPDLVLRENREVIVR